MLENFLADLKSSLTASPLVRDIEIDDEFITGNYLLFHIMYTIKMECMSQKKSLWMKSWMRFLKDLCLNNLEFIWVSSLYLVSQYIPLSDAEAQAIAYHDGMYVPEGRSVAHKEEPLLLLLHWGDMWTAKVREREKRFQ